MELDADGHLDGKDIVELVPFEEPIHAFLF